MTDSNEVLRQRVQNQRRRLAHLEKRQAEIKEALEANDGQSTFTVRQNLMEIVKIGRFTQPNTLEARMTALAAEALASIEAKIPEWVKW